MGTRLPASHAIVVTKCAPITARKESFINSFSTWVSVIAPNVNDAVNLQLLEQCLPDGAVTDMKKGT